MFFIFRNNSFCYIHRIRWHPSETSVWWYTNLYDSHASLELLSWNKDIDWFWLVAAPTLFHFVREVGKNYTF